MAFVLSLREELRGFLEVFSQSDGNATWYILPSKLKMPRVLFGIIMVTGARKGTYFLVFSHSPQYYNSFFIII